MSLMRTSPLLLVLYSLPDALCQLFGVQRLDETAILAAHEAGVVDDAGRTLYLAHQHEDTENRRIRMAVRRTVKSWMIC